MLTDKQVKKFKPILHHLITGNNDQFNIAVRKLSKLELVLLLVQTHEVMFLGKGKQIYLEGQIIYALETR